MGMQQMMALVAAALALSTLPGFAGPCSQAIDQMQAKINARLKATADAGGRAAPESSAATMHRQPTPRVDRGSPKASLATFLPRPCRL